MTPEQSAWLQVYAAVLAGLLANPSRSGGMEAARCIAEDEANLAFSRAADVS